MAKLEDEKMDLYDMAKNMSENEYDMLINSAKQIKNSNFISVYRNILVNYIIHIHYIIIRILHQWLLF